MTRFFSGKGQQGPDTTNRASPYDALMASASQGGGAAPKMGRVARALAETSAPVELPEVMKVLPKARPSTPYNPDITQNIDYPYQRALLETIYGPESKGRYNVMYGGSTFEDYSDHPRQHHKIESGPNKGQTSTAAGAGQINEPTWDEQAKKLGLKDFFPLSQDKANWNLAAERYERATEGKSLSEALRSGDPKIIANVGRILSGTWTSLPGGIEQGIGSDAFIDAYSHNLSRLTPSDPARLARDVTPDESQPTLPMLQWAVRNLSLNEAQRAKAMREIERRQNNSGGE